MKPEGLPSKAQAAHFPLQTSIISRFLTLLLLFLGLAAAYNKWLQQSPQSALILRNFLREELPLLPWPFGQRLQALKSVDRWRWLPCFDTIEEDIDVDIDLLDSLENCYFSVLMARHR